MHFSSIWPIDRTLSCATTPGHSGPESDSNEEVLHIPQSFCITGTSPSDCLVSYPGHLWGVSYPSVEVPSVYSVASADWATLLLLDLSNHMILESLIETLVGDKHLNRAVGNSTHAHWFLRRLWPVMKKCWGEIKYFEHINRVRIVHIPAIKNKECWGLQQQTDRATQGDEPKWWMVVP